MMAIDCVHPTLAQLIVVQFRAHVRRFRQRFFTRRRFATSALAIALGVVWVGNSVLSVVFRDPFDAGTFRRVLPGVLMGYALWHLFRVWVFKPKTSIEWSGAERELVCGGPFSRAQALQYRLAGALPAAVLKAACVTVLLVRDLPSWPVGFPAILLSLMYIELLRMALDITACGVSRGVFLGLRVLAVAAAAAVAGRAVWAALSIPPEAGLASLEALRRGGEELLQLKETGPGRWCAWPFDTMAALITTGGVSGALLARFAATTGLFAAGVWLVIRLDWHFYHANIERERRGFLRALRRDAPKNVQANDSARALPCVPFAAGVGPLMWRQMRGARNHLGGLAVASLAPLVLILLPVLQPMDARTSFLHVASGLVLCTCLLFPAALKFDFRRDYDRLGVLKSLPLRPASVVFGQLAAPIAISTLFQLAVLALAFVCRPVSLWALSGTLLLLFPLNVCVFAAENVIFLISPHRLRQEGIEVFLRTILTFTAKSLLLALVLLAVLAWLWVARSIVASTPAVDSAWGFRGLFLGGLWFVTVSGAAGISMLLVRRFDHFDPSTQAAG